MKKLIILPLTFVVFMLAGCAPALSESDFEMTVDIQPREIRLNFANSLQQKADISYSITNNSDVAISADSYSIIIGMGRPGEFETTIFTDISGEILPSDTLKGTYQKNFLKVVGADGDQEIQLKVYEKDDETLIEFKTVSIPIKIVYED